MKKILIWLPLFFLIVAINSPFPIIDKENFMDFFWRFSSEEAFQKERTKFPILFIQLNDDYEKDTLIIDQASFPRQEFSPLFNTESRPQFYDNFSQELRDTDERVFKWIGQGTDIDIAYYFKRIEGKWYFVKKEDFSL